MTEKQFIVLGDVVSSRNISDRESFRERLQQTLESVNDEYSHEIRAPFQFLKGVDEIGGVLSDISVLYDILKYIYLESYPIKIRLVGVYGDVDVGEDAKRVTEMDGPAFHIADEIMGEIHNEHRLFRLDTGDAFADVLIGNQINLHFTIIDTWTEREAEVVCRYEKQKNQRAVAKELNISQQRVSNVLRETNWEMLRGMENELKDALGIYAARLEHDRST